MKLHDIKKNLKIWSILVLIYSLPYIAYIQLNQGNSCNLQLHAVVTLIVLSIVFYSYFTSTSFFKNIKNKKTFYLALKISVILKIITVFPLDIWFVAMFSYILTSGLLSIEISWKTCPDEWLLFSTNLALGITHIVLINLIIIFLATLIWILIKLWKKIFKKGKTA
jgi:hypothetical protein